MHLALITDGNPDNNLYVYTPEMNEKLIRSFHSYTDSGDMEYETFRNVATTGQIQEVTRLNQVPQEHRNWLPFSIDHPDVADDFVEGIPINEFINLAG